MKRLSLLLLLLLVLAPAPRIDAEQTRIKDIARIAGLERVDLIGYGVVVGLAGTGDKDTTLSHQTIANLLKNFNLTLALADVKNKNIAAVMVTATARPFHKEGDRIDVTISSLGDAESLEGGTLLMTPLLDPNGELYALAQGPVTVGGFSAGKEKSGGETVKKGITTTATIPECALLRKSQSVDFVQDGMLRLILRYPDFTTANRIADAIHDGIGSAAIAKDAGTVTVYLTQKPSDITQVAQFISRMEQISVEPDAQAKIVVNERTGTIVMGANVRVAEAIVAHGNLTVTIKETLTASQPSNLMLGSGSQPGIKSLETPNSATGVNEETARVIVMPHTTTVQQLADAINRMGATPRDLISILQALRRMGAIQVEIEAM